LNLRRFMKMTAALSIIALALSASLAGAQEPTDTPEPPSGECQIGQICVEEGEVGTEGGTRGPVIDPPGAQVRSLITLGLIAAVIAAYLFIAFSGKRPAFPFRGGRTPRL
jgi:hypothetical protein